MNIRNILDAESYYNEQVNNLDKEIAMAREHNKNIDNIKVLYDRIFSLKQVVELYSNNLDVIKAVTIEAEHHYQTKRIEYLNSLITKALLDIFPNEGFTVRVIYDYVRKDTVKLELIDQLGNISSPIIGQGQLMQYVISFSAVIGIVRGLGFKNVFIDEAFGVAAVEKLHDLGEVIYKYLQEGIQIILVSQNPSLYSDIPHRVIKLEKNVSTGCTDIVSIEDVDVRFR